MFEIIASTKTIINPEITDSINRLFSVGFESLVLAATAGLTYGINLGLRMIKNNLVRAFATRAVAYAEQRMLGNDEKRRVVAAKIHEKFPRLGQEEVDHFLEEAVVNLKTATAATPPIAS